MLYYDRINKRYMRLFWVQEIGMYLAVEDKPAEFLAPEAYMNMIKKGVLEFVED